MPFRTAKIEPKKVKMAIKIAIIGAITAPATIQHA
jgi:hypothetical protein